MRFLRGAAKICKEKMLTERKKPTFTPEQRADLRRLGLIEAQVDALEATLPLSRAWLQCQPRMQDVRDELLKLSNAIKRVEVVVSRLENADRNSPARNEAQQRIWEAGDDPQEVSRAFSTLKAAIQQAEQSLPKTQRRHRAANPFPIKRICIALMHGFVKEELSKQESRYKPDFKLAFPQKLRLRRKFLRRLSHPLPPYPAKELSSWPTSQFSRIVGICYEAMGMTTTYPERAIRSYIKLMDQTEKVGREKIRNSVVTFVKE